MNTKTYTLTVTEAADALGIDKGRVSKLCTDGILATNGEKGHARRISAASLMEYRRRQKPRHAMTKPKPVPPVDRRGEGEQAMTLLKRFRRQLGTLPDEWQRWVAESLAAGVRVEEQEA